MIASRIVTAINRTSALTSELASVCCGCGVSRTSIDLGVAVGGLSVADGIGVMVGGSVAFRKSGEGVIVIVGVYDAVGSGVRVDEGVGVMDGVAVSSKYGVKP